MRNVLLLFFFYCVHDCNINWLKHSLIENVSYSHLTRALVCEATAEGQLNAHDFLTDDNLFLYVRMK